MRETILKYARAYASAELPVFPLHGKIPATRHGLKDATTNLDQITAWFDNNQGHNIGLPVMPGAIVIDTDPRHNPHGLEQLENRYLPPQPSHCQAEDNSHSADTTRTRWSKG